MGLFKQIDRPGTGNRQDLIFDQSILIYITKPAVYRGLCCFRVKRLSCWACRSMLGRPFIRESSTSSDWQPSFLVMQGVQQHRSTFLWDAETNSAW